MDILLLIAGGILGAFLLSKGDSNELESSTGNGVDRGSDNGSGQPGSGTEINSGWVTDTVPETQPLTIPTVVDSTEPANKKD